MEKSLDDRVLDYLRCCGGSTAWAMRSAVGERDRPMISKALQRLKRKGLVRTSYISTAYWIPTKTSGVEHE